MSVSKETTDKIIRDIGEARKYFVAVADAAQIVVNRHRLRPCVDGGKDCSICHLEKVLNGQL